MQKHFVHIQYGCGIQSEACCSLNHDITTSLRLRSTPKKTKSTPHLHRRNSVRMAPYGHSHLIKLSRHFVYIQYGCGMQSEASCSLNHDMTTSLRLRSTPQTPKSTPPLHWPNSVRVDPYAHSHLIKVPKHIVYIQYGYGVQSEACCSLNHDMTTSLRLRSTPKPQNPPPTYTAGLTV